MYHIAPTSPRVPLVTENSQRDGNTRPPDLPLEKPYAGQETTVRTGHEQQTGSK